MRPIIYQLFVRHFSNCEEAGVEWGSIDQNGCGKFNQISEEALESLAHLGVTHIWLTGVLRHATQTSYDQLPSQEQTIVKGIAGSPYAVVDYFDVDPDLAENVNDRLVEFASLMIRCRKFGLIPLIDFIPNHVSRAYHSEHHDFGEGDDHKTFFNKNQGYYYLQPDPSIPAPPLKLPDGYFSGEKDFGRVTGNNCVSWAPSPFDWYETIKLNYGYDFVAGLGSLHSLPHWLSLKDDVPRTWQIMDDVITFWQKLGIGGFRCDMAHMIPMDFWKWEISRARVRMPGVFFIAEAYNDNMKTTFGDPTEALIDAGFEGVYDADAYHLAKAVYENGAWANDFDRLFNRPTMMQRHGVRYIENHDEVRVSSPKAWAGIGDKIIISMMTLLYASSQAPILLYNGQEVGEKAEGPGGFGGNDGKTSIFDYTHLNQLQLWVAKGKFDGSSMGEREKEIHHLHSRILKVMSHPAMVDGEFYGLNWANMQNMTFGREPGETSSGHWVYAMLRKDPHSKKCLMIVCNLSPTLNFYNLKVYIPRNALDWCQLFTDRVRMIDLISEDISESIQRTSELSELGFVCPLKPGMVGVWELRPC